MKYKKQFQKIRISNNNNLIIFFIDIVIALVANKGDLFDNEQVPEEEAEKYAKKIGAIFRVTSAATGLGIDGLFYVIGRKILDPNYSGDNDGEIEENENEEKITKNKNENEDKDKEKEEKIIRLDSRKLISKNNKCLNLIIFQQ